MEALFSKFVPSILISSSHFAVIVRRDCRRMCKASARIAQLAIPGYILTQGTDKLTLRISVKHFYEFMRYNTFAKWLWTPEFCIRSRQRARSRFL
jgi:hypothetical protein